MVYLAIVGVFVGLILLLVVGDQLKWKNKRTKGLIAETIGIILMLSCIGFLCKGFMTEVVEQDRACTELSKFEKGDVVQVNGLDKKFIVTNYSCLNKQVTYKLVAEGLPEMNIEESKLNAQ